ncbi:hypothetical protein ES703_79332 [subsurface metagenome]
MYQLNAIDPQWFKMPASLAWSKFDLSYSCPEGATGAILCIYNDDSSNDHYLALRKPGAAHDLYRQLEQEQQTWLIVGLDADLCFEYRNDDSGKFEFFVMGYTGRNVVFLDTPIDILPTIAATWRTVDIEAVMPGAIIMLSDFGGATMAHTEHSIRPLGAINSDVAGYWHKWPFCNVPASGKIQTFTQWHDTDHQDWLAYAYIKEDATGDDDGIALHPLLAWTWNVCDISGLHAESRWAFVEVIEYVANAEISARKLHSYFNKHEWSYGHNYVISHLNEEHKMQLYVTDAFSHAWLRAETH